jgi:hypothetical protein
MLPLPMSPIVVMVNGQAERAGGGSLNERARLSRTWQPTGVAAHHRIVVEDVPEVHLPALSPS